MLHEAMIICLWRIYPWPAYIYNVLSIFNEKAFDHQVTINDKTEP